MKNPKNFDYDKKKPGSTKEYIIQKEFESDRDDINKVFKEPPLIKAIEVNQGSTKIKKTNNSSSKTSVSKNKIKINNSKLSVKKTVRKSFYCGISYIYWIRTNPSPIIKIQIINIYCLFIWIIHHCIGK